jgi:hypothetical protein
MSIRWATTATHTASSPSDNDEMANATTAGTDQATAPAAMSAVAVGVDPGRHQHDGVDDPTVLADLHRQRIRGDEGERPGLSQRAGPERGHLLVEISGHPGYLRLRQ